VTVAAYPGFPSNCYSDPNKRLNARGANAPVDLALAEDTENTWFEAERALVRARHHSLQKFIDVGKGDPDFQKFTKYSSDKWAANEPWESFADAYSLWLVDPEFLKTNYRRVYDFFQNGGYRI
jgi:hypothetical protein